MTEATFTRCYKTGHVHGRKLQILTGEVFTLPDRDRQFAVVRMMIGYPGGSRRMWTLFDVATGIQLCTAKEASKDREALLSAAPAILSRWTDEALETQFNKSLLSHAKSILAS